MKERLSPYSADIEEDYEIKNLATSSEVLRERGTKVSSSQSGGEFILNSLRKVDKNELKPLSLCGFDSFLSSTALREFSINPYKIKIGKEFDSIVKRGKSSTSWFFGFKRHLAINDRGDIIAFCLTLGNFDDRDWFLFSMLTAELFGKLCADRDYISANLFAKLWGIMAFSLLFSAAIIYHCRQAPEFVE